jgi:hypothetical protein
MSTCEDTFPPSGSDPSAALRYFNMPIEQIPGFKAEDPQLLFRSPNSGLVWLSIPQTGCIDVMSKLNLDEPETPKIEMKKIRPLQLLDDPDPILLKTIDVVTCVSLGDGGLTMERRRITVLNTGDATSSCDPIETTECPSS